MENLNNIYFKPDLTIAVFKGMPLKNSHVAFSITDMTLDLKEAKGYEGHGK